MLCNGVNDVIIVLHKSRFNIVRSVRTATLLLLLLLLLCQDMPKELQPQFILDVEKEELFINAGLQDRVIQVRGLLYVV